MNTLPVFETERLILRAVTEDDFTAYKKYFVDYEVISHLAAGVPWPYPENGVEEYLRTNILPFQGSGQWMWGLFLKDNLHELIGAIELIREANPANRGFWLGRPFWGQGYMTEAVEPIIAYAFDQLGFDKFIFANAAGNERSRRIKEKTGARFLYTQPARYVNPAYTEREIWELDKQEWNARRSKTLTDQTSLKKTAG